MSKQIKSFFIFSTIFLCYSISHIYKLVFLPVFADESIYIRWSQLIIDDWSRYLFFPLNDGKTPLQMWLMVPLQFIFNDQLFAGRFLSVIVGLIQVWLNWLLIKALGGQKKAQITTVMLTMFLPFWFFHHRMALIDGLLTLFLTASLFFLVKLCQQPQIQRRNFKLIFVAGFFFGLSLLTKLPAVLFLPVFALLNVLRFHFQAKKPQFMEFSLQLAISAGIGLLMFASFRLSPTFGQLFSRGGDFLYPLSELLPNITKILWNNTQTFSAAFYYYLTLPVIAIALYGLAVKKNRWLIIFLWLAALAWLGPMFILGKTVYPRYLLPAGIFITLAAGLNTELLLKQLGQQTTKKIIFYLILLVGTVWPASNFILTSYFSLENIPFTKHDKVQYLEEWSAGFGAKEAVLLIQQIAQNRRVCVLTEGYFGTLPDAILMYFHRRDTTNLTIEGIGQPVTGIPDWAVVKAAEYEQVILIVNSHRLKLPEEQLKQIHLIREDCRPHQSPCQQIWDITPLIQTRSALVHDSLL